MEIKSHENTTKNVEIKQYNDIPLKKHQKIDTLDTRILLSCDIGFLFEHSIERSKSYSKYEKLSDYNISINIAKNKKHFTVLNCSGIYQFDIHSRKCIRKI